VIRHVVVFTWRPDATDEQKKLVTDQLSTLPKLMPWVRSYKFGADLGINADNADFAVTADFDDLAGYEAYRDFPAHLDIISTTVRPIAAQRVAVQLEF
jgi:hypothetical protein